MLKSKKPVKVTHKEIKEDQLVTAYSEVMAVYYKFQKQILIAGAAVLVVVLGVAGYLFLQHQNEKEAAGLLAKVYPLIEANQTELALNGDEKTSLIGLKQIADEFGSTPSGTIAEFYSARFSYDLKKYEDAETYFDAVSSDDAGLQSAAYAGLAAVKETQQEWKEAAGLYKKAASLSDTPALSPRYLHLAGLCLSEAGEYADAVEILTEMKEKYKESPYGKEADKYITLFKAKIPE